MFDIYDNPEKEDNEFTSTGAKHWTFSKFRRKVCSIAQDFIESCNTSPPSIIGLCEIENDSCVDFLVKRTPLKSIGYKYYITSSPDIRGINIAILYDPLIIKPLSFKEHIVNLENSATRNLLHSVLLLNKGDTLDLIFCHLPSRRGGITASDKHRKNAYTQIKYLCDSISKIRSSYNLIIMGDMNDSPLSSVQSKNLLCMPLDNVPEDISLYNLSENINVKSGNIQNSTKSRYINNKIKGTYKYQGKWDMLDQIVVSGKLLQNTNPRIKDYYIFCSSSMITEDSKYSGFRPHPTFFGYKYEGGSSDHLPIIIEIEE